MVDLMGVLLVPGTQLARADSVIGYLTAARHSNSILAFGNATVLVLSNAHPDVDKLMAVVGHVLMPIMVLQQLKHLPLQMLLEKFSWQQMAR